MKSSETPTNREIKINFKITNISIIMCFYIIKKCISKTMNEVYIRFFTQ